MFFKGKGIDGEDVKSWVAQTERGDGNTAADHSTNFRGFINKSQKSTCSSSYPSYPPQKKNNWNQAGIYIYTFIYLLCIKHESMTLKMSHEWNWYNWCFMLPAVLPLIFIPWPWIRWTSEVDLLGAWVGQRGYVEGDKGEHETWCWCVNCVICYFSVVFNL